MVALEKNRFPKCTKPKRKEVKCTATKSEEAKCVLIPCKRYDLKKISSNRATVKQRKVNMDIIRVASSIMAEAFPLIDIKDHIVKGMRASDQIDNSNIFKVTLLFLSSKRT